jgi:hypothetical protein
MPSTILDYEKTWQEMQQYFQRAVACDPWFSAPVLVIDWAITHGLNQKTFAWKSHDRLVISNRSMRATRAKKLVVIPKRDSIELSYSRDGKCVRKVETDLARLTDELDQFDFSRE